MNVARLSLVLCGLLLGSMGVDHAVAQRTVPSIDETMRCFQESPPSIPQSKCSEGVVPVEYVVFGWRTFESASVDAVAEQLLGLLSADDSYIRNRAATMLGMLGAERDGSPGRANAIAYLQEGYERTRFDDVRRSLVDMTAVQSDKPAAVAFLGRVLRDPSTRGGGPHEIGKAAALRLSQLGPTGVAELQRLDASGLSDEDSKAWVRRHLRGDSKGH